MENTNQFAKAVNTVAALLALWPAITFAQDAGSGAGDAGKAALQAKVGELKQSLADNQKAIRQYTWTETTQISLKGEVKKTEKKQCRDGTDGKVIKTDLGDAAPPPPSQQGGGRRRGGALITAPDIGKGAGAINGTIHTHRHYLTGESHCLHFEEGQRSHRATQERPAVHLRQLQAGRSSRHRW